MGSCGNLENLICKALQIRENPRREALEIWEALDVLENPSWEAQKFLARIFEFWPRILNFGHILATFGHEICAHFGHGAKNLATHEF